MKEFLVGLTAIIVIIIISGLIGSFIEYLQKKVLTQILPEKVKPVFKMLLGTLIILILMLIICLVALIQKFGYFIINLF